MIALMQRPWTRGRHAWSLAIEEGAETEIYQFDVPSPRRIVHEVLGLHKKKKNSYLELTLTGMRTSHHDERHTGDHRLATDILREAHVLHFCK